MSIADLANRAAAMVDQTQTKAAGDYDYTPPAAGLTYGRFIEYIELGKQPQRPYQGKPKPDCEEVRITFELLNPKRDIREIEVDGGTKKIADRISVRVPIKLSDKAQFVKLFRKMTYGRDAIKHMAQMLGEPFLITIVHNTSAKDPNKVYANIRDADGNWLIGPPRHVDPLTGESKDISKLIPAELSPQRIFIWDMPDKEQWSSLYIDGTRTVTRDGKEVEVSKNWIQEVILGAKNFPGSPLAALLSGTDQLSIDPETPTGTGAQAALDALSQDTAGDTSTADDLSALGLDDEIPF